MVKKFCLTLLIMTIFLTACDQIREFALVQGAANASGQEKGAISAELQVYEENLVEQYIPVLEEMDKASRYSIAIEIADNMQDINGHLQVTYTNNEDVDLHEIYFRMFPNVSGQYMVASNIRVDDVEVPLVLEYRDTAIRVDLPDALRPGVSLQISMDFDQIVPASMGGNYGLYIYQQGILALDQFFPIIPVYDDEGWNVEDPPINADMIYTDEAFFQVSVTAPGNLVIAGSGVELSNVIEGEKQVAVYAGGPLRDFYLAASPRFISVSQLVGDTRVTSYFVEEYHDSGKMVLETAVHALETYNRRLGLYPYTELDLISTPMSAGGMEYSSATSLSINYYDPNYMVGALQYLEGATAHEIAHQWFFNQVMSDQLDEPWLDEALVQYATYLYYLDRYGENGAQGYIQTWFLRWNGVEMEEIPIGRPARDYDRSEYSPIVYGRGPLFIRALEEYIGEEIFAQFLLDYTEKYRWGISDPTSLKQLAEEKCDCDLSDLFNDWVF